MAIQDIMRIAAIDTLLGMGTVFAVLIIISLCIWGIGIFFKQEDPAASAVSAQGTLPSKQAVSNSDEDEEIVAVISAAIYQFIRNQHGEAAADEERYIVRNIRRK